MKQRFLISIGFAVFFFSFSRLAGATVLFSDFGAGNTYDCCHASTISNAFGPIADSFTVAGSGAETVSQINIAMTEEQPGNGFYVSIWNDDSGSLGTQVAGAYWGNLNTTDTFGSAGSGGLTSITGIGGVTLTGGDSYFLMVGSMSSPTDSWYTWNWNSIGLYTLGLAASDPQITGWNTIDYQYTGAFDVIGPATATPEPSTFLMLGSGLIVLAGIVRRRFVRG